MLIGLAVALGLAAGAAAESPAPTAPEASQAAPAPQAAAPATEAAPEQKPAPAVEKKPAPATETKPEPAAETKPADAKQAAAPAAPRATPSHAIALGPVVKDASGREGRIHDVKPGDTLWEISDAYLGTPWVWPSIWKDNTEVENPHLIYPGNKLFVSANEMRLLSDSEAASMLGAAGADSPAALADGMQLGAPAAYRYTPIETAGFVSLEELNGAATIVDSTEERVWLGEHDDVIIGLGEGETEVGSQYEIFRTTNVVQDPDLGVPIGHATLALGWLEVTEVHPETSIARIKLSRGEIRRADHLLPREKPSAEIQVGPRPEVEGRVVYTWADRLEMGQNDVIYLNRGTADGLAVGSPLEVYRPIGTGIDQAQGRERALPDDVIAKLLVISATPETATAVVTHSATEINKGDYFRGSDGITQ
jgi:LysM repeat protein